jgi:hypothetical protein
LHWPTDDIFDCNDGQINLDSFHVEIIHTQRHTRRDGGGEILLFKKKRNFFVLVYKKDGEKKRKILPDNKAKTRVQSAHGDADDFDGRGARERE